MNDEFRIQGLNIIISSAVETDRSSFGLDIIISRYNSGSRSILQFLSIVSMFSKMRGAVHVFFFFLVLFPSLVYCFKCAQSSWFCMYPIYNCCVFFICIKDQVQLVLLFPIVFMKFHLLYIVLVSSYLDGRCCKTEKKVEDLIHWITTGSLLSQYNICTTIYTVSLFDTHVLQ